MLETNTAKPTGIPLGVGVHNGLTTLIAAQAGFDFLWVGPESLSARLGLAGPAEVVPRDLAALVAEMVAVCDVPVYVDAGGGYGEDATARVVRLLEQAGASAVCLHDREPGAAGPRAGADVSRQIAAACAARGRMRVIVGTRIPAGETDAAGVTARLAAYELAGADAALLSLENGGLDLLGRIRSGEQRLPVMLVGEELDEPVGYDLEALGVSEIVYRDVVLRVAHDRVTRNVTAIRGSGLLATVLGDIAPVQQVFDLAAKR